VPTVLKSGSLKLLETSGPLQACNGIALPFRGIALLIHDHGTSRGEGTVSRPGRSLPSVKTRYPLYRRLAGPQGRSGQVRKISPLPGFDPRTVQPIASRYTDYATRPTTDNVGEKKTALFWAIMHRVAQQRAFVIYFAAEA